jgi:hypothetical protein
MGRKPIARKPGQELLNKKVEETTLLEPLSSND